MISIITPVYNGERFIDSCIKVIIDQACPNVEHIIIDGNSTDRTVEVIKQYADKYSHIRWLSEKDQGQSDAMNKGIKIANGEIISFLNVDDFYEPNVLNRVLKIFEELPEPSLVVGNCNEWDEAGNLLVRKPAKLKLSDLLQGFHINIFPINPTSYFYHTSLHQKIGFYKTDEHYAMDLDFILRAVQVANVKYVDETWGNWMRIEGTKTVTLWQIPEQGYKVIDHIFRAYRCNLPWWQRWQVAIAYESDRYLNRQIKPYLKKILKLT